MLVKFRRAYTTPDKHALTHVGGGHAVIYGPDGRSLVEKLPEDQEGLLVAEIDLGVISISKAAMDPVGHYSRPDVHRLLFNPTPAKRVHIFDPQYVENQTEDEDTLLS